MENYSDYNKNLNNLDFKRKRSLKYNINLISKTKITSHLISFEQFKKGSFLLEERKPVHGIYIILKGKIKVFNTGLNNKEQTLRLLSEGDIVGLSSLNSTNYWATALAIEDVESYFINPKNLKKILKSNNKLCLLLIDALSFRLRHYEMRQKHLSIFPASERIIDAIMLTANKFGKKTKLGLEVSTCTSRKDIANFANTSINQTSITLNFLKSKKYISINGKSIHIEKKEELITLLKNYSTSKYFKGDFNFCYPNLYY